MLEVKGLYKKYNKLQVLTNINLRAEEGQIYGLVGSNGCGKTTLMKHIIGIFKQDIGSISYNGWEIKAGASALENFYYVQDFLYFPNQYSLNRLYDYEKIFYNNISREKFEKLVEYFDIDVNKDLNQMSKGQKKQAAFIMAISTCPKVLLLDEIVDGLDAVVKRKFWNILLQEISENKIIVIISSHDLKELDNICDKVGIVHNGQLIKEDTIENLKKDLKRIQFAIEGEFDLQDEISFEIVKTIKMGSVYICNLFGNLDDFKKSLYNKYKVLLFDELPMNLEEIFITELGIIGYGVETLEEDE